MKTPQEREKHFREELETLLKRHGAEIEVEEECIKTYFSRHLIKITMDSIYDDESGDRLADFCEFEL